MNKSYKTKKGKMDIKTDNWGKSDEKQKRFIHF